MQLLKDLTLCLLLVALIYAGQKADMLAVGLLLGLGFLSGLVHLMEKDRA
ncbi:hypothetical protein [Deinococcus cellulosilyticus]|uniref:Uncharacterized protein n=1 Tax=Deinococcus cellulosilyticus (strain DSM 18568 / NBRC 106333 / KACC 11606 / 5516J-15) TaxID=1223518 RepID=A0A511MZY4_DEIC1|nr:hypothetical protein [Deinococcus cellulosilyticus]GEM45696.1 hypothetical protein DC3_13310 [Deinococcus cellulosilyticus NBRC 106333 = KACC 11606]